MVREPVVVLEGADQRVMFASTSFAELLDTTPDALLGQPLMRLGDGWSEPALQAPLIRLLVANGAESAFDHQETRLTLPRARRRVRSHALRPALGFAGRRRAAPRAAGHRPD